VPLRSSTAIWWRSAIASSNSAVRVRGSLPASGGAVFGGGVIRAGYRQPSETTNQFAWIKF